MSFRKWFLVLVMGLGGMGWAGADEAEGNAIAVIEKLDGFVIRDEAKPGKPVVEVNLFRTRVTDAGLKELAPLTRVTELYLSGTQVTDVGLKELSPLKNLTTLTLSDTRITDAGLKELAAIKNLTRLYLIRTEVTDAGIAELQRALPSCKIER